MGFTPWYQHQTFPAISIPLNVEGAADNIGSSGLNIPVANFSMVIRDLARNQDTAGTGTFAIVTASPAVVSYQFSDADTLVGTNTELFVEAIVPGVGGGKIVYDPIAFPFTAS